MLILAQQDDALDLVALVAPDHLAIVAGNAVDAVGPEHYLGLVQADAAQARLVADHHAASANGLARFEPAALDDVLQEDVLVVDRSDDQFADLEDALVLLVTNLGGRGQGQAAALSLAQLFQPGAVFFLGLL